MGGVKSGLRCFRIRTVEEVEKDKKERGKEGRGNVVEILYAHLYHCKMSLRLLADNLESLYNSGGSADRSGVYSRLYPNKSDARWLGSIPTILRSLSTCTSYHGEVKATWLKHRRHFIHLLTSIQSVWCLPTEILRNTRRNTGFADRRSRISKS